MDARGRFSHDEFGLKPDVLGIGLVGGLDAIDEELCGDGTHFVERLEHGGEARVEVFGDDDVVEANDGDVVRAGEAASWMARMAPMAEVSLKQKSAVKSRVRERRSRTGG